MYTGCSRKRGSSSQPQPWLHSTLILKDFKRMTPLIIGTEQIIAEPRIKEKARRKGRDIDPRGLLGVTASARVTQASHSRAAPIPAQRRVKMNEETPGDDDQGIGRGTSLSQAHPTLSLRHRAPRTRSAARNRVLPSPSLRPRGHTTMPSHHPRSPLC